MTATVSQRLVVLLAFLAPVVGVLASKGMTVLVVVVGMAGLARWAKEEFPWENLNYPLAAALCLLALWSAVTVAWTFHPAKALFLVGRLTVLVAAGAGVLYACARLDGIYRRAAENALLAGIALGLGALAVGFAYAKTTGDSLWTTYFNDPLTTLNNGAVTISLLAWPVFAVLWQRGHKVCFIVSSLAVYGGFSFLASAAALAAPLAGLTAFFVVRFWGRRGALVVGAVVAALILASPQIVSSTLSGERAEEISRELPPSALHRMKIWSFVVEKIEEKPLWGWGMDASRSIPKEARRLGLYTEILPLHPHNAFLQVRLELGIPGAIIAAALAAAFFSIVAGHPAVPWTGAVIAGAGGAYLAVAALSYGVWQNWWVSFAWTLAALTTMVLNQYPVENSLVSGENSS